MKCAGIMGWPVGHSLSPRLHSYWFNQYKIDGAYIPLAVRPEELERALKLLPEKNFCGVNLTVPHKESALKFMDTVDPVARRIGAVNTVVVRDDGALEGRNTDAYGFGESLRAAGFKGHDRPVVLLGAGGAARAILVALLDQGIPEIRIVNRTSEKAERLAKEFSMKAFSWDDLSHTFENAALLINATSLGMKGQLSLDVSLDGLPRDAVVTDIVYTPLVTGLLRQAQTRGHKTIDGLSMLLHQARPAFAAFFGHDPDVTDALRKFVLEGLKT